ncbi:MAG: NADH:ubiquinone reductase (Na(+)-transporting) subunit F [Bacteroidales bacterium]|nr:NADH:ubiquinone reductase (Na(+)-transporting) subunit F [Bacteroidales bacterium]
MTTISISVAVFLIVILLLVVILLVSKKYLVASGVVKININDTKDVEVSVGSTLLSTLSEQKIFLPSACGGKGSCGQCNCQVLEGGGDIQPTEKDHFSRKQVKDNWRLGCQVKVKNDLKIVVPESVLGIKKWECEVVSNRNVATFIKEFVVRLPEGEHLNFIPGSYSQIDIPKYSLKYSDFDIEDKFRGDWDHFKMFDLTCTNEEETYRAYSMANYPAEGDVIKLNVRIATPPFDRVNGGFMKVNPGIASSYIFSLKPGDKVIMSGPFGDFHPILTTKNEMLYIGGGAGMAPLRAQILHMLNTLKIKDRKISYWYGARSKAEIFYEEDFRALEKEFPNFSFHIALSAALPEDNWTGPTGFIHDVIYNNYLKDHEAPEDIEYYMCGPGPMSDAAKRMLDSLGVAPESINFDDFGA